MRKYRIVVIAIAMIIKKKREKEKVKKEQGKIDQKEKLEKRNKGYKEES